MCSFIRGPESPFTGGSHDEVFGAAFEPEVIEAMTAALDRAVASLPEPVSTSHVNSLAESILRTAKAGERDIATLERIALLELQVTPRT
jgi:hypothetical protein